VRGVEWIFFDCFNTLVDDFDAQGDESGLSPIVHLPAEAGAFPSAAAFRRAYLDWRSRNLQDDGREIRLGDRLRAVLRGRGSLGPTAVEALATRMVEVFERDYPSTLRETPGAREMLAAWQGKLRMAVVSNFFLPGWPERVLRRFDLFEPFEFVLDSATLGVRKPGPGIFLEALRHAALGPGDRGRALFVGDHPRNDVEAPRALGLRALLLPRTRDPSERDVWSWFRPGLSLDLTVSSTCP
jgi:putative hydrolase of the HAD superfamily